MSSIQARNVNHPEYQENLNETKYTIVRDAILAVLPDDDDRSGLAFPELEDRVRTHLLSQPVSMDLFPKPGSVRWYTKAVRLDLEARGLIERVPGQTPIRLRRVP
jgi:hypothetical protein